MKGWSTLSRRLLPWLALIGIWEVLSRVFPQIPSAVHVLGLVGRRLTDAEFLSALGGSLRRMVIGYGAVCAVGIGAGVVVGRTRWLNELFGTVAVAIHAMPGAVWVPLAVFFFGLSEAAVIFTIFLGAAGITMANTSNGIREVPPGLLRAAETMGARGPALFWHVTLPAAVPRIVDGLRLAWAFGWRALMAGELLIPSIKGMGRLLNEVARARQLDQLIAFMIIIAVVGVVVDYGFFRRLERGIAARWGLAG
ncbi:MAG: ABC transporter permease [Candidatus Omnitrophica bacterium CG11_big_fil_rev_8_21_14_0_20_64_10]|nr:MAG: ABC transporter permease [Candidatus Omnitrophica bacterium CG11_big_fil_rev_8_21_14_0_20_64_10]